MSDYWFDEWQTMVRQVFETWTPEFKAIFPRNKEPFQRIQYDLRMVAVEGLHKTLLNYPALKDAATHVAAKLVILNDARNTQTEGFGTTAFTSSMIEEQRIVLAEDARLEHLVGNLLAMARLEEGRLGPRSEIDMDDLVMAQTQRMTGVRLDLSGVSGGRVWGNPDELTSVVRNLLDNAARHARSTVAVSVRETGPWVVVSVGDDGPGVPVEDRERVFERFARLQEGRSRDQGGTGLGLAIVKHIAHTHKGMVEVESTPSKGSTFTITLPGTAPPMR